MRTSAARRIEPLHLDNMFTMAIMGPGDCDTEFNSLTIERIENLEVGNI